MGSNISRHICTAKLTWSSGWPKQSKTISLEGDFQQFLADLPEQLSQARLLAFSSNLNMLESWNRRLQDAGLQVQRGL